MSKIEKLSISGVRSFAHNVPMTLQFQQPLTLIVGVNGSGKTTIIETLKFITTGELPPNSAKGGSFVHDPEMAGEKEVLAKLQLLFTNAEDMRMVVTRNLQLTVKKGVRSCKQLEGSIRMVKDGERNTISSRSGDLNSMMPRFLGVSKAILNYVVFCHQEESLWPLETPQKLKEKFDEIFEALKYSKAIDNIKVLQKNQKIDLKTHEVNVEHAKADHEKGKKSMQLQRQLDRQFNELKQKKEELGRQLHEAQRKAEGFWEQVGKADLIVSELKGKRIARQTKDESVQSIRQNLTEMSDSDEELQRMLEQYEERIQAFKQDYEAQATHYHELTDEIQSARNTLSTKEREVGSFEAQKQSFDRQVQSRNRLVQETARSHDMRGYDLDIDEAKAKTFLEHLTRKARDQQSEFEQSRSEAQEELQAQQKKLNSVYERKSAKTQSKETARQAINTYNGKISGLQQQQNNMDVDEGGKATLESQLQETQTQLQSAKSELSSSDWNAVIESSEAEMRRLDDGKEKLDTEYAEAARRAGDSAQLDYVQKELKDRQRSLETMKNAHDEKIGAVVGNNWSPSTLEKDFQRVAEQTAATLTEAERQRNGTSQELGYLNAKIKERESEIASAQSDIKDATKTIKTAVDCPPEDYLYEMQMMEDNRDELKSSAEQLEKVREFLQSAIKGAKERHVCRLCTRKVSDQELNALTRAAEAQIENYTPKQERKEELKKAEEDVKEGKEARPAYETWNKLKNNVLPEKQADLNELQQQHKRLTMQLEDQDYAFEEKKRAKSDVDSMSRTVQNIAKYVAEISTLDTQVKELSEKQKTAGLSRGLEAIEGDLKKINEEAKATKARHGEATNSRDRAKARVSTLELRASELKGKVSQAEFQLKEKKSLQSQEEEYRTLVAEKREEIRKTDSELQDLASEQSTEQLKYDEITRRSADKDRELQDKASKLHASVNKLKMADQEIQSYHDRGGDEQLKRGRREVDSAKSELNRLLEDQQGIGRDIKKLESEGRDHEQWKRSIADNQRFRRDLRQLETLNKEIEELESHNAEADKARYEREAGRWQKDRNQFAAEEAGVSGQLKSIDAQLEQAQKDWETDYKDAADKHQKCQILVATTKAAIDDLGRYATALDKAIMKYHSLKMEEINRIIAELWSNTYQGTDVDTILIRSENETQKANKSYNYRVCMVKQETEMDMRGRCSAGQKVLASIIIRLALAECFGNNCGVIALDEPTTNLDRDNIQALAVSLGQIIRVRRAQRNFQIIVITHDEDFLRAMNGSDFSDNYYRVSRDAALKSCIDRQSISEIM